MMAKSKFFLQLSSDFDTGYMIRNMGFNFF